MGAIRPHKTEVDTEAAWDGPRAVSEAPNDAEVLRYMHAWVADDGDPEAKSSYKFPHHEPRKGAPANLRAINNALARLSQAKIPEADKAGVERHLRKHREDAGLEKGTTGGGMEFKRARHYVKSLDEESRTVTGIFAVHGNIDDEGDMSVNGSFAKRLEGRSRVRFLWNHNAMNPPIASVLNIREVVREELPEKVLEVAPEATGGVEITRRYYDGVPLAEWVFRAIVAGDVTEMSYAYDVHGSEKRKLEDGREIRVLTDVELFDVSDVNWGMNPATAAVKSGILGAGMTFTEHSLATVAALEEFLARVQDRKSWREMEGRMLSEAVRERLAKLREMLDEILRESEPLADAAEVQALINEYLETERMIAEVIA